MGRFPQGNAKPMGLLPFWKFTFLLGIPVVFDYRQPTGLPFVQMKLDVAELSHKAVGFVSVSRFSTYLKFVTDREKELIFAR
ncbi:hypothetical protein [Lunatibacter salilacus]|uniref:hypothetical protein n=1 Tax=Lunatibacter salilacus TaxID=2483804 RepID=UPI00131CFAE4|nr:hypothetical protein [Lunatibacter salilacus]